MEVKFVTDRYHTYSAKYGQTFDNDPACLYCGVADMDVEAPEAILNRLRERLDHGVLGYTDMPQNYKKLISDWMGERYHCPVKQDWILFSPRINMALNMAVETFTLPGDSILVNTPAYPALTNAVEKWGRNLKESPLIRKDGRFTLDFDAMEAMVNAETKAYIFCNPHNPTGRVWTEEELKAVLEFCKKHKLMLLSDDIHSDFVWPGSTYTPFLNLCDDPEAERIILFQSITKTFNIPGVICSNIILPNPHMRKAMADTIDRWGLHNPNVFVADLMNTAYTDCGEWIEAMKEIIYKNLKTAETFIRKELPLLDVCAPEGTFLMWIGYKRTGLTEEEMRSRLERIKLVPLMGSHFKEAGRGYIRLNLGTSEEQVMEILKRLARWDERD